MPSPLLLARPSGPYVRFLVPLDLRAHLGQRFIVVPLRVPYGDAARLVAARMAVALSRAFELLREGQRVDLKKALEAAQSAGRKDLMLERERRADGSYAERWTIETPEDLALFKQAQADGLENLGVFPETALIEQAEAEAARRRRRSPLLSKAIADHLGDLERAHLTTKTVIESRHTLRLFAGIIGQDIRASDITADHVREFFEGVRWWPKHASKRKPYRDLSVLDVIALAKANNEPEPAAWTLSKHRGRLSVFLGSIKRAGILEVNPLDGVRAIATPGTEDTGRPFTDEELALIFGEAFAPWASKYPHRWFGAILGLYSGARVGEVGQLRADDITMVDGTWGFLIRVTPKKGQSIKGKNSRRFMPLAEPVLRAGLLVYLDEVRQAGHERLFPHLPNSTGLGFGRQLSRQFSAYIKRLGIDEPGQGFHGFRHTIASRLDEAGASASAIAALTGHARGQSVLERHYIDRSSLPDRVRTLALFRPPVELPDYTPGQFAAALKAAPKVLPMKRRKR